MQQNTSSPHGLSSGIPGGGGEPSPLFCPGVEALKGKLTLTPSLRK